MKLLRIYSKFALICVRIHTLRNNTIIYVGMWVCRYAQIFNEYSEQLPKWVYIHSKYSLCYMPNNIHMHPHMLQGAVVIGMILTTCINPRGSVQRPNTRPPAVYLAEGLSQGFIQMYTPMGWCTTTVILMRRIFL